MSTVVSLLFCVLLGVMVKVQGWWALLWFPVGFVSSLFISAQMILPVILGIPLAIKLVHTGKMRRGVFGAICLSPLIWCVVLIAASFGVGFFWPVA